MPLIETKGAASAQGFGEFAKVGAANYIEDVFQTWLYTGTGAAQTITNGIDLSTKGGLVWLKQRTTGYFYWHSLFDTARGVNKWISSNLTSGQVEYANTFTSFNSNGFTIDDSANNALINVSSVDYVSWTFRKQPKFFDVVTYTGNGSTQNIAHNLGSVPGCIIIKRTNTAEAWAVYHRSLANTQYLVLNTTAAAATDTTYWNSTTPTSTQFTVGSSSAVNAGGSSYVAYVFAHDAGGFGLTGTDNVITCGSVTTDGSGNATVTLGYEPQWILIKGGSGNSWTLLDSMRGNTTLTGTSNTEKIFFANSNAAEQSSYGFGNPTATGFVLSGWGASVSFVYIAIRRGPMKVPTSGTSVYNAATFNSGNSFTTAGFPVDFILSKQTNASNDWRALDRLRGVPPLSLYPNSTSAEVAEDFWRIDNNTGVNMVSFPANNYQNWMFQRAPKFLDVVCWTSTGTDTVNHNLGVVPELIIRKRRNSSTAGNWIVYSAALGAGKYLILDSTAAQDTSTTNWQNTTPTASVFYSGNTISTGTYVAYLFATCPGVSKVGSYTGTGNTLQVDCGFTGGARFILIKRTDSTGDWYVYDSTRGIVSGNDPYLLLNSLAAAVTSTDWVDTHNPGFELSNAAGNNVNINTATYIFLAIA